MPGFFVVLRLFLPADDKRFKTSRQTKDLLILKQFATIYKQRSGGRFQKAS